MLMVSPKTTKTHIRQAARAIHKKQKKRQLEFPRCEDQEAFFFTNQTKSETNLHIDT